MPKNTITVVLPISRSKLATLPFVAGASPHLGNKLYQRPLASTTKDQTNTIRRRPENSDDALASADHGSHIMMRLRSIASLAICLLSGRC